MTDIKKIEDLSLNAWPSHQIEFYDGWILRYSCFYTHRTNCVEQIGVSCLPLTEKIEFCEAAYRRWNTPCIFKISPLGDPALDELLEKRGYRIEHEVINMTCALDNLPHIDSPYPLKVEPSVSKEWLKGLFFLKNTVDPRHLEIVPAMYAAIPKDEAAISVTIDGKTIATGLGIIDRDTIGIYAIHVDDHYRRKGLASAIVSRLLEEGKNRGCTNAYLQVVADNEPAKNLYRSLGFRFGYRSWFRVKDI